MLKGPPLIYRDYIRGKTILKLNGCFLGKTSLAKNFQMIFRGAGGGRGEEGTNNFFFVFLNNLKKFFAVFRLSKGNS